MKDLLKENNLKITEVRLAILNLLSQSKSPIDAKTLYDLLQKLNIRTDRATVYRTISAFLKAGVIRQIDFSEGKARYELSSLPHHHHLVCDSCGTIDELILEEERLIEEAREKTDFKIENHSLEFFGLCAACQ